MIQAKNKPKSVDIMCFMHSCFINYYVICCKLIEFSISKELLQTLLVFLAMIMHWSISVIQLGVEVCWVSLPHCHHLLTLWYTVVPMSAALGNTLLGV